MIILKGAIMAKRKYEDAIKRLEDIVSELENDDIELDDALKKFEEGVKLTKECGKQIEEAERRISVLTQDAEGNIEETPFQTDSAEEEFLNRKNSNNTDATDEEDAPF